MSNKEYVRKHKEDRPVVAICYDFDKTLSPDDMQAQGFIQSVGYEISEFWKESNGLAEHNDMDQNLAYMFKMMEAAEGHILFTKDTLLNCGAQVRLFPRRRGMVSSDPGVWNSARGHRRTLYYLFRPQGDDRGNFHCRRI